MEKKNNDSEKAFGAKKYFLFAFKKYITNENRILSKRFSPSIRELLFNYIDIYEDTILKSENKMLKNSKNEIIKAVNFYLKESVFYEKNIYKEEIEYLIKDLENVETDKINQSDEMRIYNKCKAMVKKINNENIYRYLVDVVKNISSYEAADKIIETMISELLFDGISLKYLVKWYNDNISKKILSLNTDNIDGIIEYFSNLYMGEQEFKYYLSVTSKVPLEDKIFLDYNLILNKEDYDALNLINSNDSKNAKNYIQHGGDNYVYSIVIKARDYFKGLELIIDSVNSYFQMLNYLREDNGIVLNDKIVVRVSEEEYEKIRKEKYDEKTLFHQSERREKIDIKDFIEYRDKVYSNNIGFDEIANIQRAINIIKGQKDQSKENRLINLWSVLEYMLTFHEGSSIIAKVKDIVPKVVCLYVIKDKINNFWNNLNHYKDSKIDIINDIIEKCKVEDDDYRYDLEKFISYLNSKGKEITGDFDFNDSLKREVSEIGMLLFLPKSREKLINKTYIEVEMDLIRIYRDRNILIHSGRRNIKNIDYKSVRLYQYNNGILGVIIHYKKSNPSLTIEEILNSIEYTYNKYVENISSKLENEGLIGICRPKYLFIG